MGLKPATRLPSSRDLARQYGVSRGTVVAAFEQLQAEGYLRSRIGAGTYVCDWLPDDFLLANHPRLHACASKRNPLRKLSRARRAPSVPTCLPWKPSQSRFGRASLRDVSVALRARYSPAATSVVTGPCGRWWPTTSGPRVA
jgi:DNA-binding transcriptional MocR family regulator